MILGYDIEQLFSLGNLIYSAIIGLLMWWVKDRYFQKQQLRSGDIDNEIKEAEQGLKEVELLRETINVYKEINVDLRQEVSDLRTVVKTHKTDAKKLEELEDKINELFIQLAVEKENSKKLLTENNELRKQYSALQKAHEELKEEFEAYKAKHK